MSESNRCVCSGFSASVTKIQSPKASTTDNTAKPLFSRTDFAAGLSSAPITTAASQMSMRICSIGVLARKARQAPRDRLVQVGGGEK